MMEAKEEPSKKSKKQPKGGKLEAHQGTNNAARQTRSQGKYSFIQFLD